MSRRGGPEGPHKARLGPQLARVARLHRALTGEAIEGLGLFAGQERVLDALSGGPLAMSALAALLGVQAPTATKTVARLTAGGLVERAEDAGREGAAGDGRTVRVRLTGTGRRRAEAVAAIAAGLEAELATHLGEKGARRLRKLLRRVERGLEARRYSAVPKRPDGGGYASGSPGGTPVSDTPFSPATTSESIGT